MFFASLGLWAPFMQCPLEDVHLFQAPVDHRPVFRSRAGSRPGFGTRRFVTELGTGRLLAPLAVYMERRSFLSYRLAPTGHPELL